MLPTPRGPVKVDVIEVSERADSHEIEDPTDRLYEMSHAWAYRTASQVEIVVVGPDLVPVVSAVAHVAEPGPLVAMKLQAVLLRSTAKEGTDLLDIVAILLDPAARDAALTQLAACDPVIAADAALHSERWFTEQIERTFNRIRAAGGGDIGRDELTLVADLIQQQRDADSPPDPNYGRPLRISGRCHDLRALSGRVEGRRDGVEIVVEEVGVRVQGHRRGGVPEHPLDRLDVRPRAHCEARRGVSQVVRRQPWEVLRPGPTSTTANCSSSGASHAAASARHVAGSPRPVTGSPWRACQVLTAACVASVNVPSLALEGIPNRGL